MIKDEIKHHRKCLSKQGYECNCSHIKTPPTIPNYKYNEHMDEKYSNLRGCTWKQLREMVEELLDKNKDVSKMQVMLTYIASNYAIYVMASDPDNKGGKPEMEALRDSILKEASDYADENKIDPA